MPFQLGLPEILLVLVIALVFLGPKRLPEAGNAIGRGMREFRAGISGLDDDRPAQPQYEPPPMAYVPPPSYVPPVDSTESYAPPASYLLNLGMASELGVDEQAAQNVLAAVAPIVGTARVVSAAGKMVRALGLAIAIAESAAEDED